MLHADRQRFFETRQSTVFLHNALDYYLERDIQTVYLLGIEHPLQAPTGLHNWEKAEHSYV